MVARVITKTEVALRTDAILGEGATWDAAARRLLWVDILASRVHTFDPRTGGNTTLETPQHVGAAKPRAGGGLVVNLVDGIALYEPDGALRWLTRWTEPDSRGNDAAVDAHGHLWAGTMRYDEAPGGGRLRRVAPDGAVTPGVEATAVSNGIGWSPDGRTMYFNDSPTRRVDAFDVAPDGSISGRRAFVELPGDVPGYPDGLTVDAEGGVWVALWDGWSVRRYTPAGVLDRVVEVPVARPTACAFGGDALNDLYITSASTRLSAAELDAQPLAGSLFVLRDAGTGAPSVPFAG